MPNISIPRAQNFKASSRRPLILEQKTVGEKWVSLFCAMFFCH